MSKTDESNFSIISKYRSYATKRSVFLSFTFDRYSFERNRLAEVINSGISDAGPLIDSNLL
ncbi:MAG TPA: hypothetical protein OQH54_06960 [Nitrosopumilus sp.]|nr:hypothetical protein [Thermoproteota archaeon]HJJ23437.1 hypothetical protein [Nitrosopumilus sp.]